MLNRWAWFHAPSPGKRAVAVVVLLVVTSGVVAGMARLVDFPDDYNDAQSKDSFWLAERRDRLNDWRPVATRDLLIFIPAFTVFGLAALQWALPTRALRRWSSFFLLGVAACDVTETVLFRGTLDRLKADVPASDLSSRTTVTQLATYGKYLFLILVFVTLMVFVWAGHRSRRRD